MFCAGGIATPADASLVMQLGAQAVFVGSGIFKSDEPAVMAKAIVEATTHYADAGDRREGVARARRRDARRAIETSTSSSPSRLVADERRPPGAAEGVAIAAPASGARMKRACSRCRGRSASIVRCSTRSASTRSRCARREQLSGLDALFLPGGESTTITKLLDTSGLRRAARTRRSPTGSPVFGTCAGLIVLADERARRHGADQVPLFGVLDIDVLRNGYGTPARLVRGRRCDIDGIRGYVPGCVHPRAG